jgi:hypothetical protein
MSDDGEIRDLIVEWLNHGAVFELVELDANPHNRLRVTIGSRKRDDGWVVTDEHHSFSMA